MNVLALDPATRTGAAHTNGMLTTWELPSGKKHHPGHKLIDLRGRILRLHKSAPFGLIVVELAAIAADGAKQQRTAAFHSMLLGAIYEAAYQLGRLPVYEVYPSQLKKFATGSGRATKETMIAMARGQGVNPTDDNQADAWHLLQYAIATWQGGVAPAETTITTTQDQEKPF